MNADNDLRAQLAAVINSPAIINSSLHQQRKQTHRRGLGRPASNGKAKADSSRPSPTPSHDQVILIDPAIRGGDLYAQHSPIDQAAIMSNSADSGGEDSMGDGRKGGKRELSQSKRAAQNRAAQRAFRQRKEGYIKKLEEQVRELHTLEDNYKVIQTENYSLREYIIHLQGRLIESQGDFPQPPPNVDLSQPLPPKDPYDGIRRGADPTKPMRMSSMSALQASAAAAQAVVGLNDQRAHPQQPAQQLQHPQSRAPDPRAPPDGGENEEMSLRRQIQANADAIPTASATNSAAATTNPAMGS